MRRGSVLARQSLVGCWLLLVWVLLWGTVRLDVLLGGVLVAVLALRLSALPALPLRTDTRWARVPWQLVRFVVDLVRSSWEVTVATFRRGSATRSAVIELAVPTDATDAAVMAACSRISLEPGSIVLDVDRAGQRLFVYQLDIPDRAAVEAARAQAQRLLDDVFATFPRRAPKGDRG